MSKQINQTAFVNVDLNGLTNDAGVLSINELAFFSYYNVRGRIDNADFTQAIEKVTGIRLPTTPNTMAQADAVTCLWLGPDEWLLIVEPEQLTDLEPQLRTAFGSTHASVTDISGTNNMLEIAGSAARDLIAKGTPLDIHPSVFEVGQCAQTSWVKTGVTLYQSNDLPTYRIIVRRSFADYFGAWLIDAVQEFQ